VKFTLLQARTADDPVRGEERACFAEQLEVPIHDIRTYDLLRGETTLESVVEGSDVVLVGGSGAFSVYDDEPWLPSMVGTLRGLAASGFPTFASCFGFQGLVVALGGEVARDEHGSEIGSHALRPVDAAGGDPVFGALPSEFVAQQGHKDRAIRMPDGVTNLAASERCPYQALRVDGTAVYATQFHPELDHIANRARFERYYDMYKHVFGEQRAREMKDEFVPSPHANSLLVKYVGALHRGDLSK
jgi:GMP synthase (glutamine-hydrolysing)